MGVVWSHGVICDKVSMKKLIDNTMWFGATLIEYNSLATSTQDNWNHSLKKSTELKSSNVYSIRRLFRRKIKCFGRISVQKNCIIFQGFNCVDLLKAISSLQEESRSSLSKSPASSPTSLTQDFQYSNSMSSASTGGNEDFDHDFKDQLNTIVWPLHTIRHFGYKNNFFSFDSGRFSPTGEGRFTFKIKLADKFIEIFQNSYFQCSQMSPCKYQHSLSTSPYYNLSGSHSYRNISQLSTTSMPNYSSYQRKAASKSIEFTFDRENAMSNDVASVSPLNYTSLDFSTSKDIPDSMSSSANNRFDFNSGNHDSIYYLTICENQTKAVEEVLKRIG